MIAVSGSQKMRNKKEKDHLQPGTTPQKESTKDSPSMATLARDIGEGDRLVVGAEEEVRSWDNCKIHL